MKKIKLTQKEVIYELKKRVSPIQLQKLLRINISDVPKLVYTSFDGDLLSHSEQIKQLVLQQDLAPLNPESALGTYIVSTHYKGNKEPIIRDCFSLIDLTDEFWIFHKNLHSQQESLNSMPEGVRMEALYWFTTNDKKIRIVDVLGITTKLFFDKNIFFSSLSKEIAKKTIRLKKKINETVLLLAGDRHTKHADWMRKYAYKKNKVPVCPYTIISRGTLTIALQNDQFKQLLMRVSLGLKVEDIWVFGSKRTQEFSLSLLDLDVLEELFILLRLRKKLEITYIYLGDSDVPKYKNRKRWAVTLKEQQEK